MTELYDHRTIEPKWQARWEEADIFRTPELTEADHKAYILNMFPYPSGSGLHVGHLLGYTGTDIVARTARMQGKKVLHPMGWDAFGLPAENYAIKTGVHPAITTQQNVAEFKRQFRQVGISYDWSKELNTSSPEYYKWTQWFFTLLHKQGLAYRKEGLVNWCPKDQTVLANEQVINGRCDRCGSEVVQRNLKQWYFKITNYSERLLTDLEKLDWPEKIKAMQRNWIGRSEGAQLFFPLEGSEKQIEVFTTRADTLFGATYLVLAPEHTLIPEITTPAQRAALEAYQQQASKKSELERAHLDKKKTGVWTGSYAINPANQEKIPVWVADYVLGSYGTGAIMAVPAHDERDFEFAQEFGLPIVQVVSTEGGDPLPSSGPGMLLNSGEFTGEFCEDAADAIIEKVGGKKTITYRLRDWLVSRQRFWGAPIPIAYDADGREHLLPETELPVELPMDVEFRPTGESPLTQATDWRSYIDKNTGAVWQREVDTLDTFVCSSWYFLRYPTPHLESAAFDTEETRKWLPVDQYVGGAEHAVLHLLYARFFTKVLFDAGYISFDEPFLSLRNQGSILGPDHTKMSKSKGNVISPDDMVSEYGADTLRMYEMFMAPFELEKPWSTQGMVGVRRFLEKLWRLQERVVDSAASEAELQLVHRLIKKVTEDISDFKFNTAVSSMMEAVNALGELESVSSQTWQLLLTVINPFAPHITEELWEEVGFSGFASIATWPSYDEQYLRATTVEYPVQINGKVRAKVVLDAGLIDQDAIRQAVEADPKVQQQLMGKEVKKVIIVPGRLVSYVLA